jgi:hypothetical protein
MLSPHAHKSETAAADANTTTTDTTKTVVEEATTTAVAVVTLKITQTCVAGQRATRGQPAA